MFDLFFVFIRNRFFKFCNFDFKPKPSDTKSAKTKKSNSKKNPLFAKSSKSDHLLQHLSNGNVSEAYAALTGIDKKIEEGELDNPLYFLMGILAFKEGRFKKAENYLKKAHRSSRHLRDYTRFWLGKTYLKLKKPHAALGWLELPDKIERQIDIDIFWERITALIKSANWSEATQLLDERKKETRKNEFEQTKIIFFKSELANAQGKKGTTRKLRKKLLIDKAGSPFEDQMKKSLKKEGLSINTFLSNSEMMARASSLIDVGLPKEALTIYQDLSKNGKNLDTQIAYATYKARDYRKSAQHYQKLWDNQTSGESRIRTLLRLINSYARSDQFDQALKYNKKMIRLFPSSRSASISKYKVAFIYLDSGQYSKAIDAFTVYLALNPKYKKKGAQWSRLWAYYLTKDYAQTLKELEELEKKEKNKDQKIRIAYWKARCLEKLGNKADARKIYRSIINKRRTHYYTFVAAQRLNKGKLESKQIVDTSVIQHIPGHGDLPNPTGWVANIPRNDPLNRAISLAQIGLSAYAYDEAERSPFIKGGLSLDDMTLALNAAHNYRRLASLGRSYLKKSPPPGLRYHYWTLAYPQAYPQWVGIFTERYGLDTLLAWSIMREESAFKPAVVSSAQAIGLMQMIPQTGKEVAAELGKKDFHPLDLADPFTNIQFGTWYLKSRLDEFNGNIVYAIASYNAGPDALHRWEKWGNKLEIDEFIELIPYTETNKYVKKVLKSYWIYQKLYGGAKIEPTY